MSLSAVFLAALLLSGATDPDIPDPWLNTTLGGGGGTVEGGQAGSTALPTKSSSVKATGGATRTSTHPKKPRRRLVPTCSGNSPVGGADALCTQALAPCAAAGPGSYQAWIFELRPQTTKAGVQERWVMVNILCVGPDDAEDAGTPILSVREFRRLPLPAGDMHIQPDSGPVLINIPTNVYVRAEPIRLHAQVVGVDVEVEATPSSFTWTFGDGGTLVTQDRGDPYPDMRTTHTYLHPGKWPVALTTTYTGHYRRADLPGSPWLPVNGTAQVASPSVTLDVIETRAVLVR